MHFCNHGCIINLSIICLSIFWKPYPFLGIWLWLGNRFFIDNQLFMKMAWL